MTQSDSIGAIAPIRKRPKRLWAAALMNIAIGLLSLTMLTMILARPALREQMGTSSAGLALAMSLGIALMVSSALALLGKPWARWLSSPPRRSITAPWSCRTCSCCRPRT